MKTTAEVAEKLLDFIELFGAPTIILTDRGTEFNNKLANKIIKNIGVDHRVTSAYQPRTLPKRIN